MKSYIINDITRSCYYSLSFSADPYSLCFFKVKTRCNDPLDSPKVDDRFECERSCTDNTDCQFIFYEAYFKTCILYKACKPITIGDFPGNTYSKTNCPSMQKITRFSVTMKISIKFRMLNQIKVSNSVNIYYR